MSTKKLIGERVYFSERTFDCIEDLIIKSPVQCYECETGTGYVIESHIPCPQVEELIKQIKLLEEEWEIQDILNDHWYD